MREPSECVVSLTVLGEKLLEFELDSIIDFRRTKLEGLRDSATPKLFE